MEEVLDEALRDIGELNNENIIITHDPLPAVCANRSQMSQVLRNLIANSIKFRKDGGARIHISASEEADEWVFSVRDDGIGIDPNYHSKIFFIFRRLHGQEEYHGTGIGLAICKRIIEQHGGRIWVESQLDKGSTFFFTIPKMKAC